MELPCELHLEKFPLSISFSCFQLFFVVVCLFDYVLFCFVFLPESNSLIEFEVQDTFKGR